MATFKCKKKIVSIKTCPSGQGGNYTMVMGLMNPECIIIINICSVNIGTPKHINQIWKIVNNSIVVKFNQ